MNSLDRLSKPGSKKQYSPALIETLEPRLLFSAELLGGVVDSAVLAEPISMETDEFVDALEEQRLAVFNRVVDDGDVQEQISENGLLGIAPRMELVVINTTTPNYQILLDGLVDNADSDRQFGVILMDPARDGVEQLSEILAEQQDLDAVHLISHGADGKLSWGNNTLTNETLNASSEAVKGWGKALTTDGDLLIYGCDLAATEEGQRLIDRLARLTSADVAASKNLTGHASLGGDWALEYTTGEVETDTAISVELQENWLHILADDLWVATFNDVASSGAPGLDPWTDGEVLSTGATNLALEPGGNTNGIFSSVLDLGDFGRASINAIHYVSQDITLGSTNSIDLFEGDVLLSTQGASTLTSSNTLSVSSSDVFFFRSDSAGDYSHGTFTLLLDGSMITGGNITAISLVEQDTAIGDVTLSAGTFLMSTGDKAVCEFSTEDVGLGTTRGTYNVLLDGMDIGFGTAVYGVDLVEEATTLGGVDMTSGSILVTLHNDDKSVGDNAIAVGSEDIFSLTITQTGAGTTIADATLLFDGSDVGLGGVKEHLNALTLYTEGSNGDSYKEEEQNLASGGYSSDLIDKNAVGKESDSLITVGKSIAMMDGGEVSLAIIVDQQIQVILEAAPPESKSEVSKTKSDFNKGAETNKESVGDNNKEIKMTDANIDELVDVLNDPYAFDNFVPADDVESNIRSISHSIDYHGKFVENSHSDYQNEPNSFNALIAAKETIPPKFTNLHSLNVSPVDTGNIGSFDILSPLDNDIFVRGLDKIRSELNESMNEQEKGNTVASEALMGITMPLLAGVVDWLLVAGSLFASFLSVAPLWKQLDVLPVLGASKMQPDLSGEQSDSDGNAIDTTDLDESMFNS